MKLGRMRKAERELRARGETEFAFEAQAVVHAMCDEHVQVGDVLVSPAGARYVVRRRYRCGANLNYEMRYEVRPSGEYIPSGAFSQGWRVLR